MSFRVKGSGELLEIRIREGLTKAEILNIWEGIEGHSLYTSAKAGLVFFEPDTMWNVSANEMMDLGRQVKKLRALPWAFVAPDPLSFGMVRMFQSYAEGEGVYSPFLSEEQARTWLLSFIQAR